MHCHGTLVLLQVGLDSRNSGTFGETRLIPSCAARRGKQKGKSRESQTHPPCPLPPFQRAWAKVKVRRIASPLSHSQVISASISPSCHNPYDSETLNRALKGIHRKLTFPLKTDGLQWSCWSLQLWRSLAFCRAT